MPEHALFGPRFADFLISPFGPGVMLERLSGTEALGRGFKYELDLLAPRDQIDYADVLGQRVCVAFDAGSVGPRFLNGVVTAFSYAGGSMRHARYSATVEPWTALLSRHSGCRIFQNATVPDVIKTVFRDRGISEFDDRLTGEYPAWEYLTQYRETDLNFVSRLMEQEGIYYFFEHSEKEHKLVLSDGYTAHSPVPSMSEIPFYPPDENARRETEHINRWSVSHQITPGVFASRDHNFEKPRQELQSQRAQPKAHAQSDGEIYDYPGEYEEVAEGDSYARIRLEELQCEHLVATGAANVRAMGAGHLFVMTGYSRADQNREYLVVSSTIRLENNLPENAQGRGGDEFSSTFEAIESSTTFRASSITAKPMIPGIQTAIVTGKDGEEIWTDRNGRVKVQFHWDRESKRDENTSCWIRVGQTWAGGGWGAIQIPRIGQEVLVAFINGDPDRPIITGSVYNASNTPPYKLPDNKTRSGWKSRSTKDAGPDNFNELRFEDKKGEEHVYLHAEKDFVIVVENDESREIGHDRTKHVVNNETVNVDVNRTETVGANETITIGANRTENVAAAESITIGAARTTVVGAAESLTVGAARTTAIGGADSCSVGGARDATVGADDALTVAKNQTIDVGGERNLSIAKGETVAVGHGRSTTVGKDDSLVVTKKLILDAGEELVLKCGDASITLKKDGTITIKGKDVTTNGSGKISLKASGDVVIKGSKVSQN